MATSLSLRSIRAISAACASALTLLAVFVPPAGAREDRTTGGSAPGHTYLSLGDSMAFGLQFDRLFEMLDAGTYTPDAFNTGYTDVFAKDMQRRVTNQESVNLSCPGESAETMIAGGCFFASPEPDGLGLALHASYDGAQLDAAVTLLHARRGQVNPITLAIGGTDVASVIAESCGFDARCVKRSGIREELGRRLDHILQSLRAAAPEAQIIVVAFYNPFTLEAPGTDGLWKHHYTKVLTAAAARNSARLVDLSDFFDDHDICEVTFMCSSGDFHPTDLGYRLIGEQLIRAARYS